MVELDIVCGLIDVLLNPFRIASKVWGFVSAEESSGQAPSDVVRDFHLNVQGFSARYHCVQISALFDRDFRVGNVLFQDLVADCAGDDDLLERLSGDLFQERVRGLGRRLVVILDGERLGELGVVLNEDALLAHGLERPGFDDWVSELPEGPDELIEGQRLEGQVFVVAQLDEATVENEFEGVLQDYQAGGGEVTVADKAVAAGGVGHLNATEAVGLVLRYVDHEEENVRFAAAFALGSFGGDGRAVEGLPRLTWDASTKVRDWAVFGLGVLGEADSAAIRERLLACLDDPDENVREEAAPGLAKRGDARVAASLVRMLGDGIVKVRVGEAAALLEMPEDPPEWGAAECLAALRSKFGE